MKIQLPKERQVKLTILSFNDGQRLTNTLDASLCPMADGFRLSYLESDMDGLETVLSYSNGRLALSRNDGTRLCFIKDEPTAGVYCLPYGRFDAEIRTSALTCRTSAQKTELSLCYLLNLNGQEFSCKMKITAEAI